MPGRGIWAVESKSDISDDFVNALVIKVVTCEVENVLVGNVFGRKETRLLRLSAFGLEAMASGSMPLVSKNDVPGMIGALGTTPG